MQTPSDIQVDSCEATPGRARPGLTIQEASQVLNVSPTTIRRWVKEGKIPSERVSRPQGYVVLVHLPGNSVAHTGNGASAHAHPPSAGQIPVPSPASGQLSTAGLAETERAEAMAVYSARLLQPLVDRLADQEQPIREYAERLGQQTERLKIQEERLLEQRQKMEKLERRDGEGRSWWQRFFGL
jgi:excisionase family DNA binding protein